jgi:hypothetical protein
MIRLDLTGHAVTAEGDGDLDHFITVRTLQTAVTAEGDGDLDHVRTLQTEGSASRVARYLEPNLTRWDAGRLGRSVVIEETARSRSGTSVMREYDIDEAGVYSLTSGRRGLEQNRTFYVNVTFPDRETMQITVLPGSAVCPWAFDVGDLHNYRNDETFSFQVRVTHAGVGLADGEVTRVESSVAGVKFDRKNAWERLLDDDTL